MNIKGRIPSHQDRSRKHCRRANEPWKQYFPSLSHGQTASQQALTAICGNNARSRTLETLEILSAGFNVCSSWFGVAATIFLGFVAGGPIAIICGANVNFFTVGCCALSLCEFAARYSKAGGQYHWAYLLVCRRIRRGASYTTVTVNIFAWLTTSASVCSDHYLG